MVYECHLLWSYLNSYTWGLTDKRIEIPIKNERERQTYYGALENHTEQQIESSIVFFYLTG
ncbi:MAG: hypothetical protein O4860_09465 [Trichodesmium sp. St2_bin2_1]|nr:hypothetical protein [Trichodesmium sp. St2_bin2_1]